MNKRMGECFFYSPSFTQRVYSWEHVFIIFIDFLVFIARVITNDAASLYRRWRPPLRGSSK